MDGGVWGDSRLVPYICDTEDLVHCQFYISQGLRGVKCTNLYQIDKILTITAFGKPISNRFSPNIRTENMPSSYPLSLTMKYRFEKFVVKFTCLKVFGRLLLSQCLFCYSRKFLKVFFEMFIHSFIVDIRKIQFLLKSHRYQTWLQILKSFLIR